MRQDGSNGQFRRACVCAQTRVKAVGTVSNYILPSEGCYDTIRERSWLRCPATVITNSQAQAACVAHFRIGDHS